MDIGQATAVVKLGTIGCTVALMKPGTKLPHEVDITSRVDAGLGPYVPPSMAGTEIVEESLTDDEAEVELQAIEELKEEQAAVTEDSDDESSNEESEQGDDEGSEEEEVVE